jgi:hypothetical protein
MDEVQPPTSHPELLFSPQEIEHWEGPAGNVLSVNRQIDLLVIAGGLLTKRMEALSLDNTEARKNYQFASMVLSLSCRDLQQLPWAMQAYPIHVIAGRANMMAQHINLDQYASLAERHRNIIRVRTAVFLVDRQFCNAYLAKYGKWRSASD